MSARVRAMQVNNVSIPPMIAALDAQLAEFRASNAYRVAPPEDRERAERPMIAKSDELAATFLRNQAGLLDATRKNWLGTTPASVQRRAAIGHASRARDVAELVKLGGPHEARKIAEQLVAENDAAGAWGLRVALAAFPEADGHLTAGAAALALKAGTAESDDALRALLMAKREYAKTVGLASSDSTAKLTAAHAAQEIEQEDGSTQWFSEDQVAAIIGPD